MALSGPGIANALQHVPIQMRNVNFVNRTTRLAKGILIGFGASIPDVIVYLDQKAIILPKKSEDE